MKAPALFLLFLLATVTTVFGSTLDDRIQALQAALAKDPAQAGRYSGFASQISANSGLSENTAMLTNVISQIMANTTSDDVRKSAQAVLEEIANERKDKEQSYSAKVDDLMKTIPGILGKAQKAQDIDSLIESLQNLPQPPGLMYGYSPEEQQEAQKISMALQFVTSWQDFLSAANHGNTLDAQNDLRSMLMNRQPGQPALLPRSLILDRLAQLSGWKSSTPTSSASAPPTPALPTKEDTDVVLQRVRSLDDMTPAYNEISLMGVSDQKTQFATSSLNTFIGQYNDAKAGLPVTLNLNGMVNPPVSSPEIYRIRNLLLLYVLPKYFGVTEPDPAASGKTLTEYLNGLRDSAVRDQDWALLRKVIQTQQTIAYSHGGGPSEGMTFFFTALDQDIAQQYAQAVTSYQSALKVPDDFLPAKVIGDRLGAIKAAHPQEYAEGMEAFTKLLGYGESYFRAPEIFMQMAYRPMYYPGMPYGYPGFPPQVSAPAPPPPLQIPATPKPAKKTMTNDQTTAAHHHHQD